jgi:glycosyltransferase involved in cell wall biosynthesis
MSEPAPPTVPVPAAVVFVVGTTSGGTGAHVRSLAAGLSTLGAGIAVFGPAATERQLVFSAVGARFAAVEIADRPRPARDAAAVARLRLLLRAQARSASPVGGGLLVHAHGLRAGALTALALGGWRRRPVLVVTLHNAPPAAGGMTGLIHGILERIVARRADRVLCVSADLGERMRRRGARAAGRAVVPAPAAPAPAAAIADAAAVRAGLGAAGRPLVLAVGRLAPQKGFGTLLDAAATLAARDPQPLVAIAGDGPLHAHLAGRIEREGLPLRLLGHRDDILALLTAADVFVLPSVWEGQPLILQEALRAAVPIVATRTGGIPDLTGAQAALLVPPGDAGRLAAAMARVLDEPGVAARLAAAARRRASALPTEADAVDAVLADYRAASGSAGRRSRGTPC